MGAKVASGGDVRACCAAMAVWCRATSNGVVKFNSRVSLYIDQILSLYDSITTY